MICTRHLDKREGIQLPFLLSIKQSYKVPQDK